MRSFIRYSGRPATSIRRGSSVLAGRMPGRATSAIEPSLAAPARRGAPTVALQVGDVLSLEVDGDPRDQVVGCEDFARNRDEGSCCRWLPNRNLQRAKRAHFLGGLADGQMMFQYHLRRRVARGRVTREESFDESYGHSSDFSEVEGEGGEFGV